MFEVAQHDRSPDVGRQFVKRLLDVGAEVPVGVDLLRAGPRRREPVAAISREALEAYLGGPSTRRRLGAAGAGRSGSSDVSERIEEILASEVGR